MEEEPPRQVVIHSNAGRDRRRPRQPEMVGWRKYLDAITIKGFFYSFAAFCGGVGTLLILLSLIIFVFDFICWRE